MAKRNEKATYLIKQFPSKRRCAICKKKFQTKEKLHEHVKTHTGERDYPCNVPGCTKGPYATSDSLKAHKHREHGTAQLQCEICDEMFTQKALLNKHRAKHPEVQQKTCKTCKKEFDSFSNLLAHTANDDCEAPAPKQKKDRELLECPVCEKKVLHIKSHMQNSHFKEEKYVCDQCDETFTNTAARWRHREKEHPDAPKVVNKIKAQVKKQ